MNIQAAMKTRIENVKRALAGRLQVGEQAQLQALLERLEAEFCARFA